MSCKCGRRLLMALNDNIGPVHGYGLCGCGCGQKTNPAPYTDPKRGYVKGAPLRYVYGHQNRSSHVDWLVEDRGYETPCWVWQLKLNGGYAFGSRHRHPVSRYVHVQNYVAEHGPVPDGLELDHLCRVRACVNPDHLEAVEHVVNVDRSATIKVPAAECAGIVRRYRNGGVLQRELAAEYGVSQECISAIVRGERLGATL